MRRRRPRPSAAPTRTYRLTTWDLPEVNDEEAIDAYRRRLIRHVRAPVRIDELGPVRHRGFPQPQSAQQPTGPRSARPRPRTDPRRRDFDRLFRTRRRQVQVPAQEIGRASCRERMKIKEGAAAAKKQSERGVKDEE